MKTSFKLTLAALSLAILSTFTLSSCKTANSGGTHTMGSKPGYPMSNEQMSGAR
jgi:hypothetical protein